MSIVIVLAKAPVAGRVKTRLCPPLRGEQAADIALAALNDTLMAVASVAADHHVLVLDGEPGDWVPSGFVVLPQKTGLLDQRLIDAFADVFHYVGALPSSGAPTDAEEGVATESHALDQAGPPTRDRTATQKGEPVEVKTVEIPSHRNLGEPCVLIAMDTPQVHPHQLSDALRQLADADSVIGMAEDGGYWLIGLNRPDPAVFRDIPMSIASTGAAQLERLVALGHHVATVDKLRDIDTFADLDAVAAEFPNLEVSKLWITMQSTLTNS